jgi:hypothetical protein
MNKHHNHADQAVQALALTARVWETSHRGQSVQTQAGCLPFIGTGTFLVAAYLGSSVRSNSLADND